MEKIINKLSKWFNQKSKQTVEIKGPCNTQNGIGMLLSDGKLLDKVTYFSMHCEPSLPYARVTLEVFIDKFE